jgi:ribosomal protein S27AE
MPSKLDPQAEKLVERALAELKKRNVVNDYCPRCGAFDWGVEPVAIQVIPLTGSSALPSAYYPGHASVLQFTCNVCGYTMFHNLKTLGL